MSVAFRVKCPRCKSSLDVNQQGESTFFLQCTDCGHHFRARLPQTAVAPTSTLNAVDIAQPDPSEFAAASSNPWQTTRKRGITINRRALAIAGGTTLGLILLGGIGGLLANIDLSTISLDGLGPAPDSVKQLHEDWKRLTDRQASLLATIDHKTDCERLRPDYEGLLELQTRLVLRAAALGLDVGSPQDLSLNALPDFPVTRSGRRPVEIFLTPDFRELEGQLNEVADTVLHYLAWACRKDRAELDQLPKELATQVRLKRDLLDALQKLEQRASPDAVAIEIYELSAEWPSNAAPEANYRIVTSQDVPVEPRLQLLDAMTNILRNRFVREPNSSLAKALDAFDAKLLQP